MRIVDANRFFVSRLFRLGRSFLPLFLSFRRNFSGRHAPPRPPSLSLSHGIGSIFRDFPRSVSRFSAASNLHGDLSAIPEKGILILRRPRGRASFSPSESEECACKRLFKRG